MSSETDIQTFQPIVNYDNYLLFCSVTAKTYLLFEKSTVENWHGSFYEGLY